MTAERTEIGSHWTIGVAAVGFGGKPSRYRARPDLCAEHGHPGVTYHPQMNQTWCLCGEHIYEGNQHTHAACCGGPLQEDMETRR